MIRWGLCCQFVDEPIRFRTATHRYVSGLAPDARRDYLTGIARHNAAALADAVLACSRLGIGAFRMNSQILPLGTHPESGYALDALDPSGGIRDAFAYAGDLARAHDIRLSFHPDQFIVLNSARPDVVGSSVGELDFQGALAAIVGADTLALHGGGIAGDRSAALERLARGIDRLGAAARARLALENDDRHFTVADLLPLCERMGVPLIYDVHHHRCLPDGLSVGDATDSAAATWRGREPWAHISSPRDGWKGSNARAHADYIDPEDFPDEWRGRRMTVDIEAKAKERAVIVAMAAVPAATHPA